ncbi:MAG: alpha/beta fold hydrolase [Thiotrichales bacterium]|nr:alpha/beta fold hydrolase [Thiotrichales bacterium]
MQDSITPDSPPMLLLHGWGFDAAVMQPLLRILRQRYNVTAPPIPGLTMGCESGADPDAIADDLMNAHPGTSILIGWSLGGNIAIHVASRYPRNITAVVLICCSPSFVLRPAWPCGLDPGSLLGLRANLRDDAPAALAEFAGWCAMGERSVRQTRRSLLDCLQAARIPPVCLEAGLSLLHSLDQCVQLAGLKCRVLMLFAENDHLVPAAAADHSQRLSANIDVRMLADCGHGLPVSLPGITADAIHDFLQHDAA